MTTQLDAYGEGVGWTRREFCRAGMAAAGMLGLPAAGEFSQVLLAQQGDPEPEPKKLFVPKDFPKGWRFFATEKESQLKNTWLVQKDEKTGEDILKCVGKPHGYIRTMEEYSEFQFGCQWRFPTDENGNSGVLLHAVGPDKLWPQSMQLQLHRPKAGSVFPSGDAKSDNQLDMKELSRPLNAWNECIVTCRGDKIMVEVNQQKIGEVTGCKPNRGSIALQSEGSEVHFQKLWIKKLAPETS